MRSAAPSDGGDRASADGAATGGERLLSDGLVLGGPGALLAALGQARTGHMGDIVATIQREQDEIIRAPLAGVLVVQGGPGTGKTAVALHRAAYLLYTHRFPLERQGVLVVGPNPLFLRYIEQVLPSLGETGVTLSTVAGLVPEVRVRGVDDPAVAKLKGDVRMAKVMARAVRTRAASAAPRRRGPLRRRRAAAARAARPRTSWPWPGGVPGTHNAARRFVEPRWCAHWRTTTSAPAGGPGAGRRRASSDEAADAHEEQERPARSRAAPRPRGASRRSTACGPACRPTSSLHDLFGARPLLAAAGQGHPRARPRWSGSYRPRSTSLDEVPWTAADAALVDEARTLLGPRRRRPAVPGRTRRPQRGRRGRGRVLAARAWRPRPRPPRTGARRRPTTRSGPSATSWSTRSRTSRRCSCGCWRAARCRAR